MHPGITSLQTILAPFRARPDIPDLIEMRAGFLRWFPLCHQANIWNKKARAYRAIGLCVSVIQWLHEPAYNRGSPLPAWAKASTECAAVTPEPQ